MRSATARIRFVLRLGYRRWGWPLAMGVAGLLLALLVLSNPTIGALGATAWPAGALLGIAALALGLRLRRVTQPA